MSRMQVINFDGQLLDHIKASRNDEAKLMLNPDLAKASNDFGTLLHYAVSFCNTDMTRHLLELGSEVDAIGVQGKTPLMMALDQCCKNNVMEVIVLENRRSSNIVEILLKAGANIDLTDDSGKSALQTVFRIDMLHVFDIFQQFIHRVRADASSIEESASRLVDAGCTICHAVYIEDLQLLECMRKCGAVELNPLVNRYNTPLHIAAQKRNVAIIEWLLDNGADVNVRNELDETPLNRAAGFGNEEVIRLLLERGADPNAQSQKIGMTPLWQLAYTRPQDEGNSHLIECIELLIEYGALPRNLNDNILRGAVTIFDAALSHNRWRMIDLFVAYLAMLQRLGTCDAEAVMVCNGPEHQTALGQIKEYYKTCQRTLDVVVFGKSTLFDLLKDKKDFDRLRVFVRNETFADRVDDVFFKHKLGDRYGYYYKILVKHVDIAKRIVELEDKAIPVICELFEGSYNQCFAFARKVVGFLSERDLEQLIMV